MFNGPKVRYKTCEWGMESIRKRSKKQNLSNIKNNLNGKTDWRGVIIFFIILFCDLCFLFKFRIFISVKKKMKTICFQLVVVRCVSEWKRTLAMYALNLNGTALFPIIYCNGAKKYMNSLGLKCYNFVRVKHTIIHLNTNW